MTGGGDGWVGGWDLENLSPAGLGKSLHDQLGSYRPYSLQYIHKHQHDYVEHYVGCNMHATTLMNLHNSMTFSMVLEEQLFVKV
jgi:hypothetical protein